MIDVMSDNFLIISIARVGLVPPLHIDAFFTAWLVVGDAFAADVPNTLKGLTFAG